jgi:predicted phosphoribosyltransferase
MTTGRAQLPFPDRRVAGASLADALAGVDLGPDPVVLGVPRGGVPVAAAIAERLELPLDVLVAHKIGAPFQPELAIGAVAADGTRVIDRLGHELLPAVELEREADAEIERARRRQADLRTGLAPLDLAGRGVLLVDDGIAVGSTMEAAVRSARNARATRVSVAVPVASVEGAERIRSLADTLVVLATPPWFGGVGEWYVDFRQVADDEVRGLLRARPYQPLRAASAGEGE